MPGGMVRKTGTDPALRIALIIGRGNEQKPRRLLDRLVSLVQGMGYQVVWYVPARRGGYLLRDGVRTSFRPVGGRAGQGRGLGVILKRVFDKIAIRAVRRATGAVRPGSGIRPDAVEIARFIRRLPTDDVILVGQSSGGIAAVDVARLWAVRKIVCIGYPFKHPDHDDEAYRTRGLAALKKPLLIVQGDQDEYGKADELGRYALGKQSRVLAVPSTHDYNDLSERETDRVCRGVARFLAG
jgi:uncharacterized protein